MQFWLRVVLVAAALASIAPAHAALSVSPHLPTSNDEVKLLFPMFCGITTSTITRNGRDISVALTWGQCTDPPFLHEEHVSLGKLPAGEYHAVVTIPDYEPQTLSFIVFEADPIVPVRPFVVPPNIAGYPIQLTFRDGFDQGDPNCGKACYIEIGGVKYTEGTPLYAPNLAPNTIDPRVCVTYPCGEKLDSKSRTAFEGDQFAHGVALMVPRVEADHLAFSLRVRDVSRESGNFGTTIPVVREKDMVRGGDAMTLLDVPLDRRYRTKLRVYGFPTSSFEQPFASGIMVFSNSFNRGLIGWAFVSITNNETQHVTIITPAGGQP